MHGLVGAERQVGFQLPQAGFRRIGATSSPSKKVTTKSPFFTSVQNS